MPKNPLFQYTDNSNKNEIDILESINKEIIEIAGDEAKYFPKEILHSNNVFGENIYKFNKFFKFPVRFDNPSEIFDNLDDNFSKFGFNSIRDIKFYVSIKEFQECLGFEFEELGPPKIGDIFYFDFMDQYFQVTYVTDEVPKFPFGTVILYEVRVKKYDVQNDSINIEDDDDQNTSFQDMLENKEEKIEEIKTGFESHVDDYSILIGGKGTKWGTF